MNAEGTGQTRLTRYSPSRFATQPAGRRTGVRSSSVGHRDATPELYVINVDGSTCAG